MKILIAASSWHDDLAGVAERGFKALGHHTDFFEENISTTDNTLSRIANRLSLPNIARRYSESHRRHLFQRLRAKVAAIKPDLLFVINGQRYFPEDVASLHQDFGVITAAYVVDDPMLGNCWLRELSGYDHSFVIDDSWMPYMEYFAPGRVHFLAQTNDQYVFHPLNIAKTHDIGFGGTLALRLPNTPSGLLRASILNSLAESGFSIRTFAPGISETFRYYPALQKVDYTDSYQPHEKLNELYNSVRIVVSVHSPQFKHGISPRVFGAAFAGAFQLVEFKPDVDILFPPGLLQSFRSPQELNEKVRYYLANPEEAEANALKVREYALLHHTFQNRAEDVINIIKQ
jgi:spore maturation protein CgeB